MAGLSSIHQDLVNLSTNRTKNFNSTIFSGETSGFKCPPGNFSFHQLSVMYGRSENGSLLASNLTTVSIKVPTLSQIKSCLQTPIQSSMPEHFGHGLPNASARSSTDSWKPMEQNRQKLRSWAINEEARTFTKLSASGGNQNMSTNFLRKAYNTPPQPKGTPPSSSKQRESGGTGKSATGTTKPPPFFPSRNRGIKKDQNQKPLSYHVPDLSAKNDVVKIKVGQGKVKVRPVSTPGLSSTGIGTKLKLKPTNPSLGNKVTKPTKLKIRDKIKRKPLLGEKVKLKIKPNKQKHKVKVSKVKPKPTKPFRPKGKNKGCKKYIPFPFPIALPFPFGGGGGGKLFIILIYQRTSS